MLLKLRKSKFVKITAVFLVFNLLAELLTPLMGYALTSGPAQPEFSSFEPVATTNMVNDFTGDFTYNLPVLSIPGSSGGGYALSLSYHSGVTPEEEASWVGYGWTLNPGAIMRNKRGFHDDSNGDEVRYWNKMPANETVSVGASGSPELFSAKIKKLSGKLNLNLSGQVSLRYNNYKGLGLSAGVNGGLSAYGVASLGYNYTDGEGSFYASVNPAALLSGYMKDKNKNSKLYQSSLKEVKRSTRASEGLKSSDGKPLNVAARLNRQGAGSFSLAGSNYGIFTHGQSVRSSQLTRYSGSSVFLNTGVVATVAPFDIGVEIGMNGSYTRQSNVNSHGESDQADTLNTYGYMYLQGAGTTDMMDYYVDKGTTYNKRDRYLGMPVSNADNFMVTGEGLGGGFRLHRKQAGHFKPNKVKSLTRIVNIDLAAEAGLFIGTGWQVGVGQHSLEVSEWGSNQAFTSGADESVFMRFNNDLGGTVEFGDTSAERAKVTGGGMNGVKSFSADISNLTTTLGSARNGRSSYIGYRTNSEMAEKESGFYDVYYNSYTKDSDARQFVQRDTTNSIKDGIGEVVAYNEDGMQYTYGLPVYSRNEKNMRYSLEGVSDSSIKQKHLVYRNISNYDNIDIITGEENPTPYATSYLLTSITDADYIDRGLNGPSSGDFGGYTKFSYNRLFGTFDKGETDTTWYRWRIPYSGLLYDRGSLSDPKDDGGVLISGEKEVYYLETIETKTHIAKFITSNRNDGIQAAADATAATSQTAMGDTSTKLQRLDRIELYAKDEDGNEGKLLQKVHFEYDYSLAPGVPNYSGTGGKLTLKKVWFEYEGIVNTRISPYQFEYKYPTTSYAYPGRYNSILSEMSFAHDSLQNPSYHKFLVDAWGHYQYDGVNRHNNMIPWVNQDPSANFDPAAWQLKVIKLPSGGEIHIQYEQDDYRYVQNKQATVMISLKSVSSEDDNKYYINVDDIGIDDSGSPQNNADLKRLRNLIQTQFINAGERIYFKYLYRLTGDLSNPQLTDCNADYVTGYAHVKRTGIDATNGLWVVLGDPNGGNKHDLPGKVCKEFVQKERWGIAAGCGSEPLCPIKGNNGKEIILNFLRCNVRNINLTTRCEHVNFSKSYLRLPVLYKKKGGGLRVKRLLMFDEGLESNDEVLYGNEYVYETTDEDEGWTISSGVATNEPTAIREENALVDIIHRNKDEQTFLGKVISGRDKKELEGPLAESVLPGPSVGYSKVLIKNIHSGKTAPGFAVNEYFTAKDHPVKVNDTGIDNTNKDPLNLPGGIINYMVNNVWLTQGYNVILNSMHGQPRRLTAYGGNPDEPSTHFESSFQEYDYYLPGETIPVMEADGTVDQNGSYPGQEMEMVMEAKAVKDVTNNFSVMYDAGVGLGIIPLPSGSLFPSITYQETEMYTHVTTKIIRFPAIQKSVRVYQDGIYHTTTNLAHDPVSGQIVLTRTHDGYHYLNLEQSAGHKGFYHNYTFTAANQYPQMGQKAANENKILVSDVNATSFDKTVSGTDYYLEIEHTGAGDYCDEAGAFYEGDLIMVENSAGTLDGFYNVISVDGNKIALEPNYSYLTYTSNNITNATIKILTSGRTNQLSDVAGSIVTYGERETPQTTSLDTGVVNPRSRLADDLSSLLPGGGELKSDQFPSVTFNSLNNGSCVNLKDDVEKISVEYSAANNTVSLFLIDSGWIDSYWVYDTVCSVTDLATFGGAGSFDIDDDSKELVFYGEGNTCIGQSVSCINFCPDATATTWQTVLNAGASTFSDDWTINLGLYEPDLVTANDYELGNKGKWRQRSGFAYKTDITGGSKSGTAERSYNNADVFADFTAFNWADESANNTAKWLELNTVTEYTANGEPKEEQDILDIYSCAKFGYDHTVPFLLAQNTPESDVMFESFEKKYFGTDLEDAFKPDTFAIDSTNDAHSGVKSFVLTQFNRQLKLKAFTATSQMINEGLMIKVWVRDETYTHSIPVEGFIYALTDTVDLTFSKVAKTGEWTLYEANVTDISPTFSAGDPFWPVIKSKYTASNIWLDDVRVQPYDAQMTCYVYDVNTLRLLASFDDQHFGLYYQYNAEGKLTRKFIETERGKKTIQETQYNLKTVSR